MPRTKSYDTTDHPACPPPVLPRSTGGATVVHPIPVSVVGEGVVNAAPSFEHRRMTADTERMLIEELRNEGVPVGVWGLVAFSIAAAVLIILICDVF